MRHNVDKVALTARWLVIHTTQRLVFTRLDTRNMFLVFIYVFLFSFYVWRVYPVPLWPENFSYAPTTVTTLYSK